MTRDGFLSRTGGAITVTWGLKNLEKGFCTVESMAACLDTEASESICNSEYEGGPEFCNNLATCVSRGSCCCAWGLDVGGSPALKWRVEILDMTTLPGAYVLGANSADDEFVTAEMAAARDDVDDPSDTAALAEAEFYRKAQAIGTINRLAWESLKQKDGSYDLIWLGKDLDGNDIPCDDGQNPNMCPWKAISSADGTVDRGKAITL